MTGSTITVKADLDNCTKKLNLIQLEEYKKNFQSFWVKMAEQFVPATTIFISGEKWCNNDEFICTQFEECDYDFEYVDSEITVIEYGTNFVPPATGSTTTNGGGVTEGTTGGTTTNSTGGGYPWEGTTIFSEGTTILGTPVNEGWTTTFEIGPYTGPTGSLLQHKRDYNANLIKEKPQTVFV